MFRLQKLIENLDKIRSFSLLLTLMIVIHCLRFFIMLELLDAYYRDVILDRRLLLFVCLFVCHIISLLLDWLKIVRKSIVNDANVKVIVVAYLRVQKKWDLIGVRKVLTSFWILVLLWTVLCYFHHQQKIHKWLHVIFSTKLRVLLDNNATRIAMALRLGSQIL